jgi:hypothetical protein
VWYLFTKCHWDRFFSESFGSSVSIIPPMLHIHNPEDGGHTFLRNVGNHQHDYTAPPSRRPQSVNLMQLLSSKVCVLNFTACQNENINLVYLCSCLWELCFTTKFTKTQDENTHERLFIIGRHTGHPQHKFTLATAAVFVQFIGLASTNILRGRGWLSSINNHVSSPQTSMHVSV